MDLSCKFSYSQTFQLLTLSGIPLGLAYPKEGSDYEVYVTIGP